MLTTTMKESARCILQDLKALRDEVRVQIHLADRDARDAWAKLERHFRDATREVRAYTVAVTKTASKGRGRTGRAKATSTARRRSG